MRKFILTIIFLISVVISVIANDNHIEGGNEVTSVKRIKLMGNVNVVCVVDTNAQNIIEYPDTVSDWSKFLLVTLQHETLTIQTTETYVGETAFSTWDIKPLVIKVTSDVSEIENGYNSSLEVHGELKTPTIKIKLSGNGSINIDSIKSTKASLSILTGKGKICIGDINSDNLSCDILGTGTIAIENGGCKELRCKTVGTGKMELTGLKSQIAKIKYSGGGYIRCHVVEMLTSSGLGTTKINYIGNPKIKRKGNIKPNKIKLDK